MMKPALGQYLLADQHVLDSMISIITPTAQDFFVEVGPGTARLTEPLLAAGAAVNAIELDKHNAALLAPRLGKLAKRLQVTVGDAAKELPIPQNSAWRLAANLPYQISSPLLLGLSALQRMPTDVHVMVQKEFAQRACASPGSRTYGRLSVCLQALFDVQIMLEVPPDAFEPQPKVDSALLKMVPLANPIQPADPALFDKIVKTAFMHRRKRLSNSLRTLNLPAGDWSDKRAEQLSVQEYAQIADVAASGQQV